MKWVFLAVAAALTVASGVVWATLPDVASDKPVIYWVTDRNPVRDRQVEAFQQWLAREHPDVEIELRLDMANRDKQKQVMQSVSGVGGDVQDMWGGGDLRYFRELGVNVDLTETAIEMGFSPESTYDAILDEITLVDAEGNRRQYQYPCNVASTLLYVNEELLVDADGEEVFPRPPADGWTIEEFEDYGKRWVEWANRPENKTSRRRRFLVTSLNPEALTRSFGVDLFNETLTGPGLDQRTYTADGYADYRGFVEALGKRHLWTEVLRILPSKSDLRDLAAGAGYGGATPQAFVRGDFLLFEGGRYHLIQFREANKLRVAQGLGPLELSTVPPPRDVVEVSNAGSRAAMVYAGGENVDLSMYFMAFLASPDYSRSIVETADALPPNPDLLQTEAFLRPATDPEAGIYPETEHRIHGAYLENVEKRAMSRSYSPFLLFAEANRERTTVEDQVMSNTGTTPDEAADFASARIRRLFTESIDRMAEDDPRRAQYAEWAGLQEKIDARKTAGRPIPRSWVKNPFYLKYYESIGMLEDDTPAHDTLADGEPEAKK